MSIKSKYRVFLQVLLVAVLMIYAVVYVNSLISDRNNRSNPYFAFLSKHEWLDHGWLYSEFDNPDNMDPFLNTASWKAVDLDTLKARHLPTTAVWFRKKITIGGEGSQLDYATNVQLVGAMEVYLDGELISKFGRINPDGTLATSEMAISQLPVNEVDLPYGTHRIAVRVVNPELAKNLNYLKPRGTQSFRIELLPIQETINNYKQLQFAIIFYNLLFGFTLAVGGYHLIIWFSGAKVNRKDLVYAFLSLALGFRIHFVSLFLSDQGSMLFVASVILGNVLEVASLLLLIYIMRLITGDQNKIGSVVIGAAWIAVYTLVSVLGVKLTPVVYLLALLEFCRICITATLKKRPHYILSATVAILYFSGIVWVSTADLIFHMDWVILEAMVVITLLLPYTIIAVYMARRHALYQFRLHEELERNDQLRNEAIQRERILLESELLAAELNAKMEHERLQATRMTSIGVAHQFNTPLAVANLSAELILARAAEGADIEETIPYARRIVDSVERMAGMVKKLLNIVKVETQSYVGNSTMLDIDKSATQQELETGLYSRETDKEKMGDQS